MCACDTKLFPLLQPNETCAVDQRGHGIHTFCAHCAQDRTEVRGSHKPFLRPPRKPSCVRAKPRSTSVSSWLRVFNHSERKIRNARGDDLVCISSPVCPSAEVEPTIVHLPVLPYGPDRVVQFLSPLQIIHFWSHGRTSLEILGFQLTRALLRASISFGAAAK